MKSMTGYAKVQCTVGTKKVNIEIKTLNSKQLDLIVKLPSAYRSRELDIRTMLGTLERGKVEMTLSEESSATDVAMNGELLAARYNMLCDLADKLCADRENLFNTLATMPDIWNTSTTNDITDEEWQALSEGIQRAIDETDRFRSHEGAVLEKDFHLHVDMIERMLQQIPGYEAERIETAKARIRQMMADAAIKDVDQNRFEQELIYYFEKLDITEEKVRLQKHIDYFRQTMADEPSCGKKLGFVAQEMGREINTTGSKANHVEIQRLVVVMKDELEKIKEQLGNVL